MFFERIFPHPKDVTPSHWQFHQRGIDRAKVIGVNEGSRYLAVSLAPQNRVLSDKSQREDYVFTRDGAVLANRAFSLPEYSAIITELSDAPVEYHIFKPHGSNLDYPLSITRPLVACFRSGGRVLSLVQFTGEELTLVKQHSLFVSSPDGNQLLLPPLFVEKNNDQEEAPKGEPFFFNTDVIPLEYDFEPYKPGSQTLLITQGKKEVVKATWQVEDDQLVTEYTSIEHEVSKVTRSPLRRDVRAIAELAHQDAYEDPIDRSLVCAWRTVGQEIGISVGYRGDMNKLLGELNKNSKSTSSDNSNP